jgi:hypothetical protein
VILAVALVAGALIGLSLGALGGASIVVGLLTGFLALVTASSSYPHWSSHSGCR